ncbi:MAG TPA: type II toxin-antitoxin system VapC family toxin [Oscillatoriaceae cyanobacterium]
MTYLLDTNACIRLLNGTSIPLATRLKEVGPSQVRLCATVQAELVFGAYKSQFPEKNLALLEQFFRQMESIPFDERAVDAYGRIRSALEKRGTPIGPNDLQIAAVAVAHRLTLVSHNTKEFGRVSGLDLEDWEHPVV